MPTKDEYLKLLRRLPKAGIVEREGTIARVKEITTTNEDAHNLLEAIEEVYATEKRLEGVKVILDILEEFGNSKIHTPSNAPSIEIVPAKGFSPTPTASGERFGKNRARRGIGEARKRIRGNSYIIGNTAFIEASLIYEQKIEPIVNPRATAVPKNMFIDSSIDFEVFDFGDLTSYTPHIENGREPDVLLPLIPKKYAPLAEGYFTTVYYMKDWTIRTVDNVTYVSNTLFNPTTHQPALYQTTGFQLLDNKIIPVSLKFIE